MRTVAWLNKKYGTLHRETGEPFAYEVRAELMPLCDQDAAEAMLYGRGAVVNELRDALMSIDAIATRCIGEPVTAIEDELMRIGTKCRAALGPNLI